jgi:PAS domain S-box-containing protein
MNDHYATQPKTNANAEVSVSPGAATEVSRVLEHERELEHLNRLYAALSELNRTIARVSSREELFHEACKICAEKAGFQLAWIGQAEGDTHRVFPIARGGNRRDYLDEIKVYADDRPEGWGPVGRCLREGKVQVFNDFAHDPSTAPWHAPAAVRGFRSAAAIPICFQGEVWGALTIYDSEANVFQVKEIALLEEVAAALSFAMERLDEEQRRRRAELSLRLSEERYELAVRGAGVGIFDHDLRSDKIYFSPRWRQLFGYGEDELDGNFEQWRGLIHPDDRARLLKLRADFLASDAATLASEYRVRCKDGSYRWIASHSLVVRDEQGKAIRIVGSHADITDRKLAEEALEREHHTIKHLLQWSDHERQVIAYEIHDGLAQYLTGALMQFQAYEHFKETKPKSAAKAFAAGLTMLRQSHFEARRLISGVRPPILDEEGIVAAVNHLVHEQRKPGGPTIEYLSRVEFSRLSPIMENAVYRIVQEGLTNACRHSKSKKVWVELVQDGERLRVEIRDCGVGFSLKEVDQGRFGLHGMRERARLLGGTASIESEPGKGTRVVVELPVVVRSGEETS